MEYPLTTAEKLAPYPLGTAPDRVFAAAAGVSLSSVSRARAAAGIPVYPWRQFAPTKPPAPVVREPGAGPTTAEKLAGALADGTLRTEPLDVLAARLHVGKWAVRMARKAAGIVVKPGAPRPHQGYLDGANGPVRVAAVRNNLRSRVGSDRVERVARLLGLRVDQVEPIHATMPVPPPRLPKPPPKRRRAPPKADPPIVAQEAPVPVRQPDPVPPVAEAVYDGEGDRLVPGTRVRYDAVAIMWAECKNGRRPLATVAGRLGLTVEQVRPCVSR